MYKRSTFYVYDRGSGIYSFAGQSVEPSSLSEDHGSYITLFAGSMKIPACGFIYNGGHGWYNQESYCGLWTCSTSWENADNAFRLSGISDARDNYDRAVGEPVRCVRINK